MKKILLAICLLVWLGSLTAQVQKNDWLIGGSTKFSSNKTADLKTTMFEFSPNAGYFFVNNFAVGLRVGINSVKLEGTDAVSSSLFSPFLRYYFLPAANKVNFMLDGSFGRTFVRPLLLDSLKNHTFISQIYILFKPLQ